MARRYENMTEEEAREDMLRRTRGNDRDRDRHEEGSRWMDPFGYGGGIMPGGFAWPFLPTAHPGPGYGPRSGAYDDRRRDRLNPYDGGRNRYDIEERGFLDRASDEVASWFGDDAAEARREVDHRGRGPKHYVRSDARIEEDVHDRLTDDALVDAREVTVSVKDREVTLDGTVDSRRAKRRAEDCVDSVSGVVHVQNNLRVHSSA